jgi:hypothetical protein
MTTLHQHTGAFVLALSLDKRELMKEIGLGK